MEVNSGGNPIPPDKSHQIQPHENQKKTFADITQVMGKVPGGRSWQQILEDSKQKRNILEIRMNKSKSRTDDDISKIKHLTFDELSELLFEKIMIKESDTIAIDYTTGNYGHREVELKPGVDVTPYLTKGVAIKFLDHDIYVTKQETNATTKILFRNVPLNVPDEELINLCMCYGQPRGWVTREKLTNMKDKGRVGSNRTVEVLLNKGAAFENFYWLEGPLPGDQGRRITVTHQGQPQQCSNCFNYDIPKYSQSLADKCPALGNGKACKMMGTPRARMGAYMKNLEKLVGFTTLKLKNARVGGNRAGYDIAEDDDLSDEVIFKSPVAERDEKIQELENELTNLQKDLPALKESLVKVTKQLEVEKKEKSLKETRVAKAMDITEHRIAEAIKSDFSFVVDNPQLIALLALFQDRDNFTVDAENETITPIQEEGFLRVMSLDISSTEFSEQSVPADLAKERLSDVKLKVLESLKGRWIRRNSERRNSIVSLGSSQSKRGRESLETDGRQGRAKYES